jgi:transcriptional regulator with XRE-family HTH domain
MNTGDKIRGIRQLKGLSQENIADLLKISRNAYSGIERNITDISESRLKQIADVLEVTPNDIHNFEDKRSLFFENCSGAIGVREHSFYKIPILS